MVGFVSHWPGWLNSVWLMKSHHTAINMASMFSWKRIVTLADSLLVSNAKAIKCSIGNIIRLIVKAKSVAMLAMVLTKEYIMTNPIPTSSMFATPDSVKSFMDQLDSFSNAGEKQIAMLAAMLAFNLCHKLVEEQKMAA